MGSNKKKACLLVTDTEIYRTDEILDQLNDWIQAFKTGKLIRFPDLHCEALDEYEAHLEEKLLEAQRLMNEEEVNF